MTSVRDEFDLDEGYWSAILNEGEHAKSTFIEGFAPSSTVEHSNNGSHTPQSHIELENDWNSISEIAQHDQAVELKVVGCNRGGLLVEWKTIRGFVPASQLVNFSGGHTETNGNRRDTLVERVGSSILVRVIELDAARNRLILSERAARVESGKRTEILTQLRPGDVVRGQVTNLCDFGAFIDLGGVEGLIHISELSWGRVSHPLDILKSSQMVEVYVLEVDKDAARIALSLKRMRPDPWKTVHERYQIDQIVEGEITHVVDFGAFACIEEGLEGLIHISELAEGHFLHPRNVVVEGDSVKARILSIDGKARRLGLSLRVI